MFRIVPQLIVADLERSVSFYTERLDFAVTLRDPQDAPVFVSLEREEVSLFLVSQSSREDAGSVEDLARNKRGVGVRLFFEVDDARAVYDRLTGAGVSILRELVYNAEEDYTECVLLDPDGYEIGFYS